MHHYVAPFRKFATFQGRAPRVEYWSFVIGNLLVSLLCFALTALTGRGFFMLFGGVYSLATLVPSLAVAVLRLHDTGRSGLALLWGIVPVVGGFLLLYFMVQDSEPRANQFGPAVSGR
jgi:uncharacterized membrane protein YhaH (DUF805 family)